MAASVFMLLFWLGFRRFEVCAELIAVGLKEWNAIEERERPAKFRYSTETVDRPAVKFRYARYFGKTKVSRYYQKRRKS